MTLHTALLALAAAGFVAIFSALVVTAVIVVFGGRGAPDQPGASADDMTEAPEGTEAE